MIHQKSGAHGLNPSSDTIQQIRRGVDAAFSQLLGAWQPIIKAKASTFHGIGLSRADFEQIGHLALHRAVLTFDPAKAQFNTYATTIIQRAMIDEQRRHPDEPQSSNVHAAAMAETIIYDDALITAEKDKEIARWLSVLDDRCHRIVTMIFYMDMRPTAVARQLGVSPARVSQIMADILTSAKKYISN